MSTSVLFADDEMNYINDRLKTYYFLKITTAEGKPSSYLYITARESKSLAPRDKSNSVSADHCQFDAKVPEESNVIERFT